MNNRSSLLSNPLVLGIGGLVVGLLVGWLLLGWVLFPVTYTNADPWDLNPAGKSEWVVMTADGYSLGQDLGQARERLRGLSTDQIAQSLRAEIVERNTKGDATGAARLQAFGQVYGLDLAATGGAPQPSTPPAAPASLFDNLGMLLLLLAGLILLIALGLFLYTRMRTGAARTPAAAPGGTSAMRLPGGYTSTEPAPRMTQPQSSLQEQPATAPPMPVQSQTRAAAPAAVKSLGTFAATYKFGEDNYDTSFTLETARGEFLGETGMGTSETIGEGKPDKVTAFDVWLFDKTDVRTVTQILMSEAAFNDQATRQRLATKGELVLAEKGKHVRLETATLAVDAEIVDLVYASTPGLPPNSHFQKLIVEMVPSQK